MRTLAVIQGCTITERDDLSVVFNADADVDCDGLGGNPHHDKYFQPDTFYHHNGHALTAEKVPYVVVPPVVVRATKGVVMGCKVIVTNLKNGKVVHAVVGDLGPTRKIGEVSVLCAERLGLSGDPNTGGTDEHIIKYEIFPGIPAEVDGEPYELQHAA